MRIAIQVAKYCCGALVAAVISSCGGSGGSDEVPPPTPPPVAPQIVVQPQAMSVPDGALVTFSVTATGSSPLTYQWLRGTFPLPDTNRSTLSFNASYLQAPLEPFSVIVTNMAGSATSSSATLTVTANSPIFVAQPQSTAVTVGNSAYFRAGATGTLPLTFYWQRSNDSGLTWINVSAQTVLFGFGDYNIPMVTLSDSGAQFRVLVSGPGGTATSQTATLTVM